MNPTYLGPDFAAALFVGMLVFLETGYRFGRRRMQKDPEDTAQGIGAVNSAVFGLLGLLVAFTFSGADSRFDARRQLIVTEANSIGTAWLRIDLLPPAEQDPMRDLFRRYVDSRLQTYQLLPDIDAALAELAVSESLQRSIWKQAVAACAAKNDGTSTSLVLSSLNAMIEITTTRTEAAQIHPPAVIFALLFGLGLGCSLLAGYGMAGSRTRNWIHIIGFASVLAVSVYVILELEFPRVGAIRVDATDKLLVDVRAAMDG